LIEDLIDLKGIPNRDFDGMRGAQGVELESLLITFSLEFCQSKNINNTSSHTHHELTPDLPLGMKVINCKPTDPGCKSFVQPQLIPPIHGDQVAKPLMSQLVGNNVSNPILEFCIRLSFVVEDGCGSVGDEPPIFHGTHGELVNSKKIGLGERIVNTEDFREVVDDLVGMFQGETALLFEATRSIDSDRQVFTVVFALSERFDIFKITNGPRSQLNDASSVFKVHDIMFSQDSRMYSSLESSQKPPSSGHPCCLL
jgi:hypothetical protein